MVDSFFVAFSVLLVIVGSARAQVSAPNCTDSSYGWSYNSLSQSPCFVAAYLAAVCNNGTFTIPALLPQHSYTGPNGQDNDDLCKCNTVLYNLISACDACQGEPWIAYSTWTINCTSVVTPGTFPEPIPEGTRVQKWAYLDPTTGDSWNETAARLTGDSPEVTGSGSSIPTSTKNSQSTVTPQTASSASSSSSSSKSSSNTGAIAGGVVGGVVGAALIAGIVSWYAIRRRRARSAPSAAYIGQNDMGQAAVPYPLTIDTPRLYDPSDPSTYPAQAPSPTIHTTNYSGQFPGSDSDLQTIRHVYTGLPEV